MTKILEFFSGRKAYIAACVAVAIGIYYKDMNLIMTGLIGIGLRAGIAKAE